MNPNYNYIRFLPRNRIIISTVQTLLNDSYIVGIFNTNIYPYNRDDNGIETLPSLSVYHGVLSSPDDYNIIIGTVMMDCYVGLSVTRDSLTETVDTILEVLRITIQNQNFGAQVSIDLFDYNATLNTFQTELDKKDFQSALANNNPLHRYGIGFNVEQPTIVDPSKIEDCQKIRMSFKYNISQEAYYEVLETMGIDGREDPNLIVYPRFQMFNIDIDEIDEPI